MNRPYCVIYFHQDHRFFCFDRNYRYMGEEKPLWAKLKVSDVVEVATDNDLGLDLPAWAMYTPEITELHAKARPFVVMWFKK